MGTGNLSVEKLAGMPEQRLVLQSECCLQHVETIPSGESLHIAGRCEESEDEDWRDIRTPTRTRRLAA